MKKILIIFVLIVSFFIHDNAFACKPAAAWPPTITSLVAAKDAVFIGTVQSVVQDKSVDADYRVTFKVNEAYKGNLSSDIMIKIASSSATCGYDNGYQMFSSGSVWVLYASGNALEGYTSNSLALNTQYPSVLLAQNALKGFGLVAIVDEDPIVCTMNYAPVCGKDGAGVIKTYGNACMLGAAKATTLYEGECTTETVTQTTVAVDTTIGATVAPKSPDTPVATVDTSATASVDAVANISFWQKIVLGFKSIFSFSFFK